MFGFSKRRMKIGRLKVQLSDSAQGSPIRPSKRSSNTSGEVAARVDSTSDEVNCQFPSAVVEPDNSASINYENWSVLPISGDKPTPRFNHAATVIGNKMVVMGGESANGLLDDVQVLDFDRFSWAMASSKLYLSPSSLPLKIPACKGHSLISWGQKVLLVGGKMNSGSDRLSVWVFDTETECWSLMEAKGDIPVARSCHTVVRASSVLIIFGGEDDKRKKLNDLHMFDLKSLTWLPLHCTGTGPSPRTNHVAALYDDRVLLIFGGTSKSSRALNDLYSLDFETMAWSRIKARGFHPTPRAGCCGILSGTKWFIVGGGGKKKRHAEMLVYDVQKVEWTVAIESPTSSITTNKGFSLVLVQNKQKDFLVAFGGCKKDPSNQAEVLFMEKNELSVGERSVPTKGSGTYLSENLSPSTGFVSPIITGTSQNNSGARQNLASTIEQNGSSRKSLSETLLVDPNHVSGNGSFHRQFHEEEHDTAKTARCLKDLTSSLQAAESRTKQLSSALQTQITGGKISMEELPSTFESENLTTAHGQLYGHLAPGNDDVVVPEADVNSGLLSAPLSFYQFYGGKAATLIRKNGILEGQLAAALSNREAAEKNLSSALKSRQEMEKKLAATVKEMELLKEKLSATELAREESNSLSNIVHSDNVRLEHDVAFLKAVLDDTQKELHSTRGVLAGERGRAFRLQVEVFHLKQRIQNLENRAPTPRKPFQIA